MMRPANDIAEIYLCTEAVDFRKQINGLAALVEAEFDLNPFSGRLFVFTNRHRNRVKLLYWERNGFCLWQKRLEQERFFWPKGERLTTLTGQQLNWLLDGIDIGKLRPHKTLNYQTVI